MNENVLDVIVVGAGYSGLSASYHLQKYGLSHIIFERGKIGESWRSQRWDSFRMNSTNKLNILPGEEDEPENPDAFGTAAALVSSLEKYVSKHQLPVSENSKVVSIERPDKLFKVSVLVEEEVKEFFSRQILITSGVANEIKIPSLSKNVPGHIKQLHTGEYRNSFQLPEGAVLVVGSAQSGIQITEDLLNAGRKVFLSTSEVGRIPRWYRGKDIFYWVIDTKLYEIKAEEVQDPKFFELKPPHVSGTGTGRDSLSLQSLAKRGAVILGKMNGVDKSKVYFETNAAQHIRFADEFSQRIKLMIDNFISQHKLNYPEPHHDEADLPDIDTGCASNLTSLDLKEDNINSIIWATGFGEDHSYIKLPIFNSAGKLIHKNGIPEFPGIYFLGYPWLRSRKSPILFGIFDDAEFVVDHIYQNAREKYQTK